MQILEETEVQFIKLRLSSIILLTFIFTSTGSMVGIMGFAYGYRFYIEEREKNEKEESEYYQAKFVEKAENPRFD